MELFGLYKDHQSLNSKKEDKAKREKQLRDASLESSSATHADTSESYSRSNLMEARLAAKRGDQNAKAWLAAHRDGIQRAYQEGTLID